MACSPCGGLTVGSAYNCDAPPVAGVINRLILIDKCVWDDAVIVYGTDPDPETLITDISLTNEGDAAYAFEGIRKSTNPQSALVTGAVSVGFAHQTEFLIFDISQTQKDNIKKMSLDKMVAIIQNVNAPGNVDSVFEVFGKDVGMELQAGPMRINSDLETNGAYTMNLLTAPDSGQEPLLPTSVWKTDFQTTKDMIDALLIPVPPAP